MFIEKLLLFDKKVLSENSLIFGQYRLKWLLVVSIPFGGVGLCFFIALYSDSYSVKAICLLLMLFWLGIAFGYGKSKTYIILRRHAMECKLGLNSIWNKRNIIIRQVQQHKLSAYLSAQNVTIEKVLYIIEVLKSENQYPKYKYRFLQIFITFVTVIIGAFFGAMNAVPNMFSSWQSVITFFKPIIGFSLLFTLFFWFTEAMLVRGIFDSSNRKHKRLIRLLENYYLSKI